MSANPAPQPLYDAGEAGSHSCSVDSTVRAEGPMSRTSKHHDPYYSPTSPVGRVRADRLKYLAPQPAAANAWDRTETFDPSSGTVVNPTHETEGAQLLLDYYEAVRRDRHIYWLSIVAGLFGLGGLGILIGWLASNPLVTVTGIGAGLLLAYALVTGSITLPGKAGAAKKALTSSGYFRDRSVLDGYLITTRSAAVIWEAIDLEERRRAVDYEAVRLRAHLHLTEHRQTEITQLQQQELELRQRIVVMLDQHPDTSHLSDEIRDNFGTHVNFGRLSPESTQMIWGDEGGEQR